MHVHVGVRSCVWAWVWECVRAAAKKISGEALSVLTFPPSHTYLLHPALLLSVAKCVISKTALSATLPSPLRKRVCLVCVGVCSAVADRCSDFC